MNRGPTLLTLGLVWILPTAPASAQSFGNALVIRGNEIFAGEPSHDVRSGVVYRFRRTPDGAWARTQRLEPTDGQMGDRFGIRLAMQDQTLFVSATRTDEGRGAVYVFTEEGGSWRETDRLTVADRSPADSLGSGLAVSGDWLMVGTVAQNEGRGAVYAFRREGTQWIEHSKIVPAELAPGDRFGARIALSGDWVLVSAPERENAAGAVFAYRYDAGEDTWVSRGPLLAPGLEAETGFGTDLAFDGESVLVSAPGFFQGTGVAFAYALRQGNWQPISMLSPFQAEPEGRFGTAIHLDGPDAWIGAPGSGRGTGRVFAFHRDPETGEWWEARKVPPGGGDRREAFAVSLAVSGDLAVAGALQADYGAGAAYVFHRAPDGSWTPEGRIEGEVLGMERVVGGEVRCSPEGRAAHFGCAAVDLVSFLPVHEMGAGRGVETNDVWGWTDPETRRDVALIGMTDQLAFVDVTEATAPRYLGRLPMTPGANGSTWRDVKVYRDHAFVVADGAGAHGVQVFDLTRLRELDGSDPRTFEADLVYDRIQSAHNIAINEESGFAYVVGASGGGVTCGGGLHMIDIREPTTPRFAGCFQDTTTGRQRTGYSHDVQCLMYRGPDVEHQGREICLGSNETALSIADVTDKSNPVPLSMATYPNVSYAHQGWVSEDQAYFFMNDELDEVGGAVPTTRTLVWDIRDLDDPILVKEHFSDNPAIDHNLYVVGSTMYQSNYSSGLRVLDVSDPENPIHTGFFDTVPYGTDGPDFNGSWSNYPFFEKGVVVVTSQREGLFLLRARPRPVS